jgi:hypothetical protein
MSQQINLWAFRQNLLALHRATDEREKDERFTKAMEIFTAMQTRVRHLEAELSRLCQSERAGEGQRPARGRQDAGSLG